MIIGELFDKNRALSVVNELRGKGIQAELQTTLLEGETVFQVCVTKEEDSQAAAEYFRVRMGLPGAPPEPDPEWVKLKSIPMGTITKVVLIISAGLFLTRFDKGLFEKVLNLLFYNVPGEPIFSRVLQGEVWRVITPIFLHFSFLHILFNGMWIKDLGSLLENQKGPLQFLLFVFVSGAISNTLQYIAMGPSFGGLSGVVYALLGYLWVDGRLNPDAEFRLPKRDVMLMVGWYVLCLSGFIG
ncbi:MAG: rhomboid family intramembrane serine protease, partial [Halobacteriovoraceae bacterium]|nr:rhomboid family intramembrane serine protease [Halobacteriovoraceae bacterium]